MNQPGPEYSQIRQRLDLIQLLANVILAADEKDAKEMARYIEALCRHRDLGTDMADVHGNRRAILLKYAPHELAEWEARNAKSSDQISGVPQNLIDEANKRAAKLGELTKRLQVEDEERAMWDLGEFIKLDSPNASNPARLTMQAAGYDLGDEVFVKGEIGTVYGASIGKRGEIVMLLVDFDGRLDQCEIADVRMA